MKTVFLISALLLSGCGGLSTHNYGEKYQLGQELPTSCVKVRNFDVMLRSSPKQFSDDSYVGYIDYGPGMPRGHMFLILPIRGAYESVAELLRAADPRQREMWLEGSLRAGGLPSGEWFEFVVPEKVNQVMARGRIIEREALLVRGYLHKACGKTYLVAAQANPLVSEAAEWPRLRSSAEKFASNLAWGN
ncbi:MAG: hypothetical protein AB2591_03985 [Candidatus Thiodiazotropha sp.]